MRTSSETIYTLELSSLIYGGEAMGRIEDGRAAFVPFALPGETVRARLFEEKKGYVRTDLVEVLVPSPERIQPRCLHFSVCGGCHYQHMSYQTQLAAKVAVLAEQLERIGGLVNPPVSPIIPSPDEVYYRNHIQFHLSSEGKLGYQRYRTNEVLPIQECHLPQPLINQIWPLLDFEALPEIARVGLRVGEGDDMQMILESGDPVPPELSIEELPISAVHLSPAGAMVLAGSDAVVMQVLGCSFRVSAASFFQVNTRMIDVMVGRLLDSIAEYHPLHSNTLAIDAYCGAGLFSAFLAPRVGRLIGIEASPSACEDFEANLDQFDNVELYEADVRHVLPALHEKPDIILVDPPRAGIDRYALDGLLGLKAPLLVYISCDPSTLARDARRLAAGGYHLEAVIPLDLFPQTYHIESVSFWVLAE